MKYYIIAGEASGDLHGSSLIRGLVSSDPEAQISFWGGDLMQAACPEARMVRHYRDGAVMGFTDVIAKAGKLLSSLSFCKKDIAAGCPDAVILIDYPGFNLKIARYAKRRGIKVFWYIAPKTWASREGRNSLIKKYVDRLFIIFPFEQEYFRSRGIPCSYKGNPLIGEIAAHSFARPVEGSYIAMLPGSRKGEIARMMPVCMEVADRLGCQVVIAGAPARPEDDYLRHIGSRSNVRLVFGRTADILKFADAAVVNSGTASLEAAVIDTPQVVCWSASKATVWAARHILRVQDHIRFISLGNLILNKPVVRELIQEDFTAQAVLDELQRLTGDDAYRDRMLKGYEEIRRTLGGTGASEAVAAEMVSLLRG